MNIAPPPSTQLSSGNHQGTIEQAIIRFARKYLALTPEYLEKLQFGVCFGLAVTVAIYYAEQRFDDFLTALAHINRLISSLLAREFTERCFFFQSQYIQSEVTNITQRRQSFTHTPLLTSVDIYPTYLQLSIETLISMMAQLRRQPTSSASILLSLNQTHAIALMYYAQQWWLVDSLRRTAQTTNVDVFRQYGIEPGELVHVCIVHRHTSTLFMPPNLNRSDYFFVPTRPWPQVHFGKKCPNCNKIKEKFCESNIKDVAGYICSECVRKNRLEVCGNPACTASDTDEKGQRLAKKGRFCSREIDGANVRVCDACRQKIKNDAHSEICGNPACTASDTDEKGQRLPKRGPFHDHTIDDANVRVCYACWRNIKSNAQHQICGHPTCTASDDDENNQRLAKKRRFFTHEIDGVNMLICDACRHKIKNNTSFEVCGHPTCTTSDTDEKSQRLPKNGAFYNYKIGDNKIRICNSCWQICRRVQKYACVERGCGKVFSRSSSLIQHTKTHGKPLPSTVTPPPPPQQPLDMGLHFSIPTVPSPMLLSPASLTTRGNLLYFCMNRACPAPTMSTAQQICQNCSSVMCLGKLCQNSWCINRLYPNDTQLLCTECSFASTRGALLPPSVPEASCRCSCHTSSLSMACRCDPSNCSIKQQQLAFSQDPPTCSTANCEEAPVFEGQCPTCHFMS